jgi:hypothetical protein
LFRVSIELLYELGIGVECLIIQYLTALLFIAVVSSVKWNDLTKAAITTRCSINSLILTTMLIVLRGTELYSNLEIFLAPTALYDYCAQASSGD